MRTLAAAVCIMFMMAAAPVYSRTSLIPGEPFPGRVLVQVVSSAGTEYLTIPHRDVQQDGIQVTKKYLEAKKGENYSIVIRNSSSERIGVVVAVDGRNIITGKRSELRNSEDMYIIGPYDQARLEGWRTDQDTVHRFLFTDTANSYSQRTFSDASAMGVIAVAVFRDQDRPRPQLGMDKKECAPAPASEGAARSKASGAVRDEAAGTGFGDAQYAPVTRVEFRAERLPVQKTLVKYEWREALCRKGVLSCEQDQPNRLWDDAAYAPFPPGYQRR